MRKSGPLVALVFALLFTAVALAQGPDLVIESIYGGPPIVILTWPHTVDTRVVVANTGDEPSPPTHLRCQSPTPGWQMWIISVPALAPGESIEIVVHRSQPSHSIPPGSSIKSPPWPSPPKPPPPTPILVQAPIYVEVDPFGRVGEADEYNNYKAGYLQYWTLFPIKQLPGHPLPWPPCPSPQPRPWPPGQHVVPPPQ